MKDSMARPAEAHCDYFSLGQDRRSQSASLHRSGATLLQSVMIFGLD